MKVFVTGGTGFIGTHLVGALEERGYTVTVYDKVNGDNLLDCMRLYERIKGHDFVWHLAANADTRAGIENPRIDIENGVLATHSLLEAMRLNGIRQIGFTSSATVYGDLASTVPVDEHTPTEPISLYGASKAACEALINAYVHVFDFRAWVYRLGNIVGPGMKMGVIHDLVNKLKKNPYELEVLGNGKQRRSFLWVGDCVNALLGKKAEGVYNIGNVDALFVEEVVGIVCEELKARPRTSYTGGLRGWRGDAPVVYLDVSKIRITGWKPSYSSEEAVRKAVRCFPV